MRKWVLLLFTSQGMPLKKRPEPEWNPRLSSSYRFCRQCGYQSFIYTPELAQPPLAPLVVFDITIAFSL